MRPRYVLAVVAIGTGLAAFGGCKHHRYGAMRPQFVGPATVVPVEPSPAPGIAAPAFEDEAVTPPSLLAPAAPAVRPGFREDLTWSLPRPPPPCGPDSAGSLTWSLPRPTPPPPSRMRMGFPHKGTKPLIGPISEVRSRGQAADGSVRARE